MLKRERDCISLNQKKDNVFGSYLVETKRSRGKKYGCNTIDMIHPNFLSQKLLYSIFCLNVDISKLRCEVCELSKSHHVFFPSRNNKSEIPFYLIHNNVQSSRSLSLCGFKWFISLIDDCTWVT